MEKRKFSLMVGFVCVFVIGFLAGYYLLGSGVKTSILEAEAEKDKEDAAEQFEEDSAFLDGYEVTPEKVNQFVEENATGYMYEEDGVLYVVEGAVE